MKEKLTFLILTVSLLSLVAAGCSQAAPEAQPSQGAEAVSETAPEAAPELDLHYIPTETVTTDCLTVSIDSASPTGLYIRYQIHGDSPTVNTLMDGGYTLEKKSGSGWEPLTPRYENHRFQADTVYGSQDPQFWNDSFLNFTQLYGILPPGEYRVHWQLLEGQEPEIIPFTVANRQNPEENQAIDRILSGLKKLMDQDCFHLKTTQERRDHAPSYRQYYKQGQDYLTIGHHNREGAPNMDSGVMIREDAFYVLTHEDVRTNDSPIYGWEPKATLPAGQRAEGWIPALPGFEKAEFTELSPEVISIRWSEETLDPNSPQPWQQQTFRFDSQGNLTAIQWVQVNFYATAPDYYEEFRDTWDTEILSPEDAGEMIDAQVPAQPRPFSWEEEKQAGEPETRSFRNNQPQKVTSAAQALNLALQECSVKYDGSMVYYDREADMWKVELQVLYGYQGYEYIYLDGNGLTARITKGQPRTS